MSKRRLAAVVGLAGMALPTPPLLAQREIVQPLPAEGERKLGDALARLAGNSMDVSALHDAGEAALELGDIDAAIGFFGRANELVPGNSRSKLGLARAYTRSRRPVEALRLFAEAERAGISDARMAEDRGLAFDLVGDAASAQQTYRLALANGAGDEAVRRLALSQAIAGDRKGFESTLLPLLQKRDIAAFRTRAFGLAILGDAREAKEIANTMLPAGVGARMAAYFDYMPKLTKAQQAAAANLGVFPRSSSIGTDDAGIAGYSGPAVEVARVEPAAAKPVAAERPAAIDPRNQQLRRRPDLTGSREAMGPVEANPPAQPDPSPPAPAAGPNASASPPAAARAPEQAVVPPRQSPVVVARAEPAASAAPVAASPPPSPPAREDPPSVADAFSGFALEPRAPAPAANGAVDITRIDIPREKTVPKPPPTPQPPAHPSRHWVQVATGKDTDALKFDWRRIVRKAEGKLDGKGPFVAPWGEANRLLSGPFGNAADARELVKALKALGLDSFTFTSAEGEKIDKLQ